VATEVLFLDHERQQLILLNWLLVTKTAKRGGERWGGGINESNASTDSSRGNWPSDYRPLASILPIKRSVTEDFVALNTSIR
jgi:hypothetical protein